jgi:cysteine synthase A
VERNLNVFMGVNAIQNFMNPGKMAPLPLVELPAKLNPFREDGIRILAKLMTFTSLHNVKAVPAFNMILAARDRHELEGVQAIVENSSGNTVTALAVAARLLGIDHVEAIVPT